MAVGVIYSAEAEAAVLYCTTSGFAFGPVFEHDAEAKADSFLAWFASGRAGEAARRLNLTVHAGTDGHDPRHFSESDLAELLGEWQRFALDDEGELKAAA